MLSLHIIKESSKNALQDDDEMQTIKWPEDNSFKYVSNFKECDEICEVLETLGESMATISGEQSILSSSRPESSTNAVGQLNKLVPSFTLGVDLEWCVDFVRKGKQRKVALAQVYSPYHQTCWLFHFSEFTPAGVPEGFMNLMKSRHVAKCGLNVTGDIQKLHRDFGIESRMVFELQSLAHEVFENRKSERWSLTKLTHHLTGMTLSKPKVRCGDWEASPLSKEQCLYAALDAYASFVCYELLHEVGMSTNAFSNGQSSTLEHSNWVPDQNLQVLVPINKVQVLNVPAQLPILRASPAEQVTEESKNEERFATQLRFPWRELPISAICALAHLDERSRTLQLPLLTPTEYITYELLIRGLTVSSIAVKRQLGKGTISRHVMSITSKGYELAP